MDDDKLEFERLAGEIREWQRKALRDRDGVSDSVMAAYIADDLGPDERRIVDQKLNIAPELREAIEVARGAVQSGEWKTESTEVDLTIHPPVSPANATEATSSNTLHAQPPVSTDRVLIPRDSDSSQRRRLRQSYFAAAAALSIAFVLLLAYQSEYLPWGYDQRDSLVEYYESLPVKEFRPSSVRPLLPHASRQAPPRRMPSSGQLPTVDRDADAVVSPSIVSLEAHLAASVKRKSQVAVSAARQPSPSVAAGRRIASIRAITDSFVSLPESHRNFLPNRYKKYAVPGADAQAKARAVIKEIHGDEVANAKTSQERSALAKKLLDSGKDLRDDAASQYVLFMTAMNLAVSAANLELALSVVDEMEKDFRIKAVDERIGVFSRVSKAALDDEQRKIVASAAARLAGEVQAAGQYDDAKRVASVGLAIALKLREKELIADLRLLEGELTKLQKEYANVKVAIAALKTNPTDRDANLAVGRFRCFVERKWSEGIPMLALSGDPDLAPIALKELAAPKEGPKQAEIADAWIALSDKTEDKNAKLLMRAHGAAWYEKAVTGLQGLAKKRVEKNLAEIRDELVAANFVPPRKKLVDRLIASCDDDSHVKIWDVNTGEVQQSFKLGSYYAYSVDFSPDGERLVAAGYQGQLKLWDVKAGKLITQMGGNSTSHVYAAKFSPAGNAIASAVYSNAPLRIWNGKTGKPLKAINSGTSNYVYDLAFTAKGNVVVTVGSDDAFIWDLAAGRKAGTLEHRYSLRTVACSPNGRHIVTAGYNKTINFFDTRTGRRQAALVGHTDTVLCLAFSPDSKMLVSGSEDGTVRVWDVSSGRHSALVGHNAYVNDVAFSHSGSLIASAGSDRRVIIWDAKTGKQVRTFSHTDDVRGVAFAPTE